MTPNNDCENHHSLLGERTIVIDILLIPSFPPSFVYYFNFFYIIVFFLFKEKKVQTFYLPLFYFHHHHYHTFIIQLLVRKTYTQLKNKERERHCIIKRGKKGWFIYSFNWTRKRNFLDTQFLFPLVFGLYGCNMIFRVGK